MTAPMKTMMSFATLAVLLSLFNFFYITHVTEIMVDKALREREEKLAVELSGRVNGLADAFGFKPVENPKTLIDAVKPLIEMLQSSGAGAEKVK